MSRNHGPNMHSLRNLLLGQWLCGERLSGKTVLVTGANSGIGKETARDLAKRGARIILACRDMAKAEAAQKEIIEDSGNQDVVIRRLDLSDIKSIREFAEIINKEKQVNILINNAGIMMCPYSKTVDGFEMQFGVNHLGHFLLTYLLSDLIKRSAPARIINVSSMAHSWGTIRLDDLNSETSYDSRKAYCQSKLANILFTRSLAKQLQGTGVTAYALHPGVVQTELSRHLSIPLKFAWMVGRPFTKNSVQGAQTSIYCAVAPELEKESGGYYSDCAPATCTRSAMDEEIAQKLWELSCRMLAITWE
ncbi:retinol dehydrogenase 12-like isoform X2 [Scleropages formosus]|uniref:retinol dehydrogenase 12-like isoform X2 n=1 Tax=Scleropages formosus TaxID=113540 RepID=UPI000877EFE7|nr:retinol dehydrogenase 12-like isoform X2 [Scleropages formosus]